MNGQTIYLMSRTEQIEDAAGWAQNEEFLIKGATKWYWEDVNKPNTYEFVVNVDFERLVVEVRDAKSPEITTYYLFAYDRRMP
jgi:hypothetical protein